MCNFGCWIVCSAVKEGKLIACLALFFFYLRRGTFGTAATTDLLYQPRVIGEGDCGEIGGINIGRGN
jgi:hypothetical protein